MASRAIIRLALIVALVVTAHALRPITGQSIATHLLDTVETISMVLPESTAAQLAQANYIALAFGRGLIETESKREGVWSRPASLYAVAQPEPPINTRLSRSSSRTVAGRDARVSRSGGRGRNLSARYRPLIKPVDLPTAVPATLAFNLAPVNVSLLKMPASSFSRRIARPSRFVVRPAVIVLPQKKSECETQMPTSPSRPSRTRVTEEEIEAPMVEAPMEAGAFGAPMSIELKSFEPAPARPVDQQTPILPLPGCDLMPQLEPFQPFN